MNTVERTSGSFNRTGVSIAVLLSILTSGCAMFRTPPGEPPPPSQALTFATIREEVRLEFDPATLEPTGSATNRFVFPVTYTVEGEDALDHLQILFDRYREAKGLDPVSIHDDSASRFFDVLDTRAGTVMPDFTIRQEDIDKMTPVITEPWLRQIKQETERLRSGTALPRPRRDR